MLTKFLWKVDSRLSVFSGRPTILFFRRTYFVIQAISLAYWWHWPLNEMSLNPNLIFLGRPGLPELRKLEKTEKRWNFLRYYFIILFLSLPVYAFTSNLSFVALQTKLLRPRWCDANQFSRICGQQNWNSSRSSNRFDERPWVKRETRDHLRPTFVFRWNQGFMRSDSSCGLLWTRKNPRIKFPIARFVSLIQILLLNFIRPWLS